MPRVSGARRRSLTFAFLLAAVTYLIRVLDATRQVAPQPAAAATARA